MALLLPKRKPFYLGVEWGGGSKLAFENRNVCQKNDLFGTCQDSNPGQSLTKTAPWTTRPTCLSFVLNNILYY